MGVDQLVAPLFCWSFPLGVGDMATLNDTLKRYRMAFVLVLTLLVCLAFVALIRNFLLAVLMAVVFSAVLHPVYRRVRVITRARPAPTSGMVLVLMLVAVGIPLIALGSLVGAEALAISKAVSPWLQSQIRGDGILAFQFRPGCPLVMISSRTRHSLLRNWAKRPVGPGSSCSTVFAMCRAGPLPSS